jgi:putative membrane-bound dehydrogenase-like protein
LASAATAQDDLARELPRIKPLEPAAALLSFQVHPGFHLEPAAVEPLVTDPVSACYDAEGRLYVVEMRGYPYPEKTPTGLVSRLEDRDGDGRFDTRTVFVDRLSWPTGIAPYDDGVFIAAAPDILYAKDTSGDGVADIKKVLFRGFGTENVQGLLNGLLWGPDGWIYGVTSSNGGEIEILSRPGSKPVSVRGRDFRYRPDGSAFEAISGGGQFGHSFDDWGHRFTCNNSNHIRQIVLPAHDLERNPAFVPPSVVLDIPAEGPAAPVFRISAPEPWRVVRTRQRAADPDMRKRLPPTELVATGFFTSATGITIYRGTAYPEEFRGNAFVGDVGGNLVHRKRLSVHGAAYLATRADLKVEFLASTDNWFRPVNFSNTPGGTLLILDMYRETIEHPWSIPEPIKQHLDLTSGKDRGRLYNLVHDGAAARPRRHRLQRAATALLVPLLADPDAWWRETAGRLLLERRDHSAIPLLRDLAARRPTALGRLHALWTLDVLGALDTSEIVQGLRDPEPRLREQAVKLAEPRLASDPGLLEVVLALADDADPMVRFQAALSLGEASHNARTVQALAAIAIRDAGDPWTKGAVLSSVGNCAAPMIDILARKEGFFATAVGQVWLEELASLIAAQRDAASLRGLIAQFSGARRDPDLLIRVLVAIHHGARRTGIAISELLKDDWIALKKPLFEEAREIALSDANLARRLPAIALLGFCGTHQALEVLPDLLDGRQPAAASVAALQALSALDDPAVGRLVVGRWKTMSPAVRSEAAELLFARRDRLGNLLDALEAHALTVSEIDPDRLKQLRSHKDPQLRARAQRVLGVEPSSGDRKAAIDAYRPAIALEGKPDRGRLVFQKACATCHRVLGEGVEVGPDLATVTGRSPEEMLLHILDPNREVASNYVNYNVATTDGRTISGIIVSESPAAVTLKRALGATDVIPRSQIEAITSTGLSLMPEGLEKGLTPQDLADLVALLKSIQSAPANWPASPGR